MKSVTRTTGTTIGIAACTLLLAGTAAAPARATEQPREPLPPGLTYHCEGRLVHQVGDEVSLRVKRISDTKFCAWVTKGYSSTPYKTRGKLAGVDITTGAYTTKAKSSWGKYVYIPVGKCVETSLGIQEEAGEMGQSGTFCNVS